MGDCTFTCCCFNRPVVDLIDEASGQKIGSIRDPWACCDLTFTMRDEQDEDAIFIKGGCCQLGLFLSLSLWTVRRSELRYTGCQVGALHRKHEEKGAGMSQVPLCAGR